MHEQRIQQRFIDSADLSYQWAEVLARPIAQATQALLACVTGGGKVLTCGEGASVALAQYVAALLVGGFGRPRPELPALALGADAVTLAAIVRRGDAPDALAAQVRALGSAGDLLLVLSADGQGPGLLRAVQAAHERELSVLALTGAGGGALACALRGHFAGHQHLAVVAGDADVAALVAQRVVDGAGGPQLDALVGQLRGRAAAVGGHHAAGCGRTAHHRHRAARQFGGRQGQGQQRNETG